MSESFGYKLRMLRKKRGQTLEALGKEVGTSKSYIWELENVGIKRPSAVRLNKIASALGVTSEYLLDDAANSELYLSSAEDEAFYLKYQKMTERDKNRVRRLLDLFLNET